MPKNDPTPPGRFCWIELSTTDTERAKTFYGELFGWGNKLSAPDGGEEGEASDDHGPYTLLTHGGEEIAGMYHQPKEQIAHGVPPHWMSYVAVDDVDTTIEKVKAAGGTSLMGPFDVMTLGRMAIIQDPQGATFSLWQAREHRGGCEGGLPGMACWFELMTTEAEAAGSFYREVFGWDPQTKDTGPVVYSMLMHGEVPAGGMMQITPEMGRIPPHWMVYFAVEDCDATVAQATSLGAQVCVPPMDIPEAGRFATLTDPAGAAFSIIRLLEQPDCDSGS